MKKKDQGRTSNDAYAMFLWVFFVSDFFIKAYELHWQVDAVQMGTQTFSFINK